MAALDDLRRPGEAITDPYADLTHDFRTPSEVDAAAAPPPPSRVQSAQNRIRAADLADRGIPTFRNASGDVSAITDETGTALSAFDSRHNIAYDSKGQPKQISYAETGPPIVSDPFAKLPSRVNTDTGAIEKSGPGVYRYEGQDPTVTAKLAQKERDKTLQQQSALLGRKLTLDEHDLITGNKELDESKKSLISQVPTLSDPKYEGADLETVKKGIDEHFNAQYAAPEANNTRGWFGKELSPEATALRAKIDADKAKAIAEAEGHFATADKVSALDDTVASARDQERLRVETLLAHSQGKTGPLDQQASATSATSAKPAAGLYPPEEDQARMLGGEKLEPDKVAAAPVAMIKAHIDAGNVPHEAVAASLAASNDAEDAKRKADALQATNPTLADQFRAVGDGITKGLVTGLSEIAKSTLNKFGWETLLNPVHFGGVVGIKYASMRTGVPEDQLRRLYRGAIDQVLDEPMRHAFEKNMEGTLAGKTGEFIGGIAPYVGLGVATRGRSFATPLMAAMFYNSSFQRTYDDAKEHGASDAKAEGAATAVGAVNAVLALPLKTVGAAAQAIFGDTAPKVVSRAIQNAFEHGGPEAVGGLLGRLAETIKAGGAGSEKLRTEAVEGINKVMEEISKPAGKRILDVAKSTAAGAALGAGVQTATNLISKTYDPERGTFEGVTEQAIGFGVLSGASKGFEQVVAARKAKQALDIIAKGGKPPGEAPRALGGPPPEPKPPKGPSDAKSVSEQRNDAQEPPAAVEPETAGPPAPKPVDTKVAGSQPDNADAVKPPTKGELLAAESKFVKEGGHADKLDAQNKLTALREAFPDSAARMKAIDERLASPASNEAEIAGPALVDNTGKVIVSGKIGETHADLMKKALGGPNEEAAVEALDNDKQHAFVDTNGNVLDRAAAGKVADATGQRTGQTGPLHSQHLQKASNEAAKSSTQVNIPSAAAEPIHKFVKTIAEGDLYKGEKGSDTFGGNGYGRETEPHVTALYGITHNDVKAITERVKGHGPVALTLGKISKFSSPDKPYDVLKVDVHSPDLHKLNATLKKEPFESDFPKYQPHLTLAYVKKGAADKYIGDTRFEGQTVMIPHLTFSDSAGEKTKIQLSGGGSDLAEQTVGKLAMGAMAKHKATLTALGHSSVPKLGETDTESGIQAKTEGGKTVITIDAKKLAKATENLNERAKSKFVQRAIEEEILHVAGETWERQSPENADKVKEWGKIPDELSAHLAESYEGWENLNDRQKGHEKLRAVLQKRWTGKLTEAAYRVLKEFLKYLRGIYEKLTPGQREIVDGVEAILKGEQKGGQPAEPPASNEAGAKPTKLMLREADLRVRFSAIGDKISAVDHTTIATLLRSGTGRSFDQAESRIAKLEEKYATTPGKQQSSEGGELSRVPPRADVPKNPPEIREDDGEQATGSGGAIERPSASTGPVTEPPRIDDKAGAALDSAFEGLFAALPSRLTPSKQNAVALLETVLNKKFPAWRSTPKADLPENGQRLIEQLLKQIGRTEALGAATPVLEQKAIPAEKIGGFVAAAQELVRQSIDTPGKLAALLESRYQGKARPFSQALWDMIGTVKPALRGTHDWSAIYDKKKASNEAGAPGTASPFAIKPQNAEQLTAQIALSLQTGPVTRKQLTELAKESGLDVKQVDEAAELGVVKAARFIARGEGTPEQKFDQLVELYDRQPNLTAKTSTSKVNQAYSTPSPLAYAAGVMAGLDSPTVVTYEPTAGNGLLTIAGDPRHIEVNEMDPKRAAALRVQGFRRVTEKNALNVVHMAKFGAVIANPPFGTIVGDDQKSQEFTLLRTGETTKNIDQAIAMQALDSMADDGRAVLILGGKNIKDPEERAKAYATPNQMKFWGPLYQQYKVVDHFTVDGDLYSKQGAGWPVDVIVIAGRGRSEIQLPSADGPRMIGSWDELRNEISRTDADRIDAGRYDPEKDRAKVSGIVGAIRQLAEPEPATGAKGNLERPASADGGTRSSTDVARPDSGERPVVSGGAEPGVVDRPEESGRVGDVLHPVEPEQREQQLEDFRVPYKPASKLPSFGIFVPTNMEAPARDALAKLEKSVGGSIDAYVREKLGYPADAPIERYFSAEQMDALALGVNAVENKTAFVLGDQGGVGKGRVAAGMMRYAIKEGKVPIFITKDVKLYAAMIEDLHDIGSDDIVPMFTDNNIAFRDYAENQWKQGNTMKVMKEIARTGKLLGADALFTTYNQIQADLPPKYSANKAERYSLKAAHRAPPDGARMEALKKLAPNSIIIADESHLAAGDSIRAWRLHPLLAMAHGVYYSSATFAKRPDSMGIYNRTSLSHATNSIDDLVDAMKQGGVPLQQVVSATLASDGLYLRRERDFGKAVFHTHINLDTKDRDTYLADNYTDGLRSILSISNKMKEAKDLLNRLMRREGKNLQVDNPPRIETTNFASKLHNMIGQYLFAIKAESAVRRAVEGVTKGFTNKEGVTSPHKIIIAFQNTMQAPILNLEHSHRPLSFNGMLLSYLDTQRVLTSGRGANAQTISITDKPDPNFAETPDHLLEKMLIGSPKLDPQTGETSASVNEPALAEMFRRIMSGVFKAAEAKIEALDLADMPLSPIDHIRHKLAQAGVKTGEITGRSIGIDEDGALYNIDPSTHTKAAHLRTLTEFNNSDTDVLLMNASGSTGISAHAGPKFKRKDPRAMLILQGHLDINEFMQTLWRIDRTGQIHQPYYENIQTALPAELRPAAIRGKKMAKLNANTTSNAESEISEGNKGVDIFNQYGDEVVHGYLRSDPTFTRMLDFVNIVDDNGNILPLADVLALYEENGQFAAAVTGRAAVLPTAEQEAFWEKVMADYVAHIDYLNELGENELVSDTVDLKAETLESKELTPAKQGNSGFDAPSVLEKIKADIGLKPLTASEVIDMMTKLGETAHEIREVWRTTAAAWKATELARLKEKILSWDDEKAASYEARWREQEEEISASIDLIGDGLHIQTEKGLDGYGAITDVKFDDEHPLTPSKQIFTIHVNTTKKTLRVPASQLPTIARIAAGDFHDVYEATAERSNQRYMITGNLLAAYLAIRDNAPTAKIVQYTTDKGDLRQGILMPAKFSPGSLAKKRVVDSPQHMLKLLMAGRSLMNAGGEVTLVKAPSGGYVMRVPSSRLMGGAYWRDSQLAKLMDGGEFIERGGAMIGKFGNDNSHLVYQRLLDLNASLFYTEEGEALGAARPVRAVKEFGASIEAVSKDLGMGAKESFRMLQHLLSPSTGVAMEAHDRVMKMLGERNQKGYETDRVLEAAREAFDKLPRPELIDFIDRMKQGEPQKTPELQTVASTMRKIDTESWEAARAAYAALGFKDKEIPLKWLENHYRVLWKKIPGDTSEEKSEWIGRARRGLRGSMGQHKQHTLETMSDGLAMGGKPYSYNPVEMFKLAQADLWKLTTTLKVWKWAKDNGFVEFVRGAFPKAPVGMVPLDDSIANVYFPAESGEGLIQGGKYFVEEGFGRLLNNYLSKDYIRQTKIGRGLLWLKNATTSLELALSVFHGVFETLETVGSNIGLGLSQLVNRGILHGDMGAVATGLKNMVTAPVSPVTGFSLGREIRKAAGDPAAYFQTANGKKMLKSYPRAREMIDDLFAGGWKPNELEQDWKNASIRTFIEAVSDIKAGDSDNYVGAFLRAFPAANEMLMKPLFDYYIPNLKVAQFFKEYAEAIEQNERKLKGGVLTRTALARQVWRLVEDRFGELNYDTLFWNANFKTAMQLLFRSVTWKLGSVEAFYGAFKGQGKEFIDAAKERRAPELHRNMAWLAGMFLLTATLGYIISKTLAGKDPENPTDYVFPRIDPHDDKVRVSLPTYFKDMVHLIHSPTSYVTSSMSGWIGRVMDLLRNKDYFGVQIRDTDDSVTKQALAVGKYTAQMILPFSIRGYKNLSANDVGAMRKLLAIVGVNPAPRFIGQSAAERESEDYWRNQRAEGGISPASFEAKAEKRKLVKQIEHGEAPNLSEALAAGTIKPRDIKPLYQRAQMGALASQVQHMPLEEAEKVFQRATLRERAELQGIMAKKRKNSALRGRRAFTGF